VFKHIPDADQTQQLINRLVEGDHHRRSRNAARYEAQYEGRYEAGYERDAGWDGDDRPTQRFER
jgi:hypothetical protein